jgi:hypothetical protein
VVNLIGVIVLAVVALLFWNSSSYEHAVATTDPARLQQKLRPGDIAVVFDQPVTGTLNTTLDFRTHGGNVFPVSISGDLVRKPDGTEPLRWAIFAYGSLKLAPEINVQVYRTPAPLNLAGQSFACQSGNVQAGLLGVQARLCSKAGLNQAGFPDHPIAANYDPQLVCPIRGEHGTKAQQVFGAIAFVNCSMHHSGNPALSPGPLEVYTGSTKLGDSPRVSFELDSGAAGPFLGHGGGRVEGVTGVVGGTDTLLTILSSIPSLKAIPKFSQKAIGGALKTFQYAPAKLAASETVATDWTDGNGNLGQGVDLLSSSQPPTAPRQLVFSWKAGEAPGNVWWELENRLSVEDAQSQDFFAGVWAAVAATAALMALALLGKTCGDLIVGRFAGHEGV